MKSFNKLYGLSLLSLFICFAACTSETVEPTPTPAPEPSGQTERRNVLLTLQNKLSVAKTNNDTKAETIATADENKISSLDIYVFGSKTEDGTYTYQERFCYRENSSDLPPGSDVTAIDLNAVGDKGTETTALLSLKKGLFVKLYCIANQSKLIDPATKNEFNNFVPLVQSNPGQAGNTVTEGIPVEADFKLLQSIQLDPASATDLLLTPLPMTGAYTTPLDLTDFSVSARLQLGFRLTRSVARFDIINDAKTSKFTIQSVSMANGRKGVSFFPLTVTGTKPATAGNLITYPARKFDGVKANEGTCTGAFYSWPSPLEDAGYLILSGTYAANATENIPVTYQVPFKPAGEGNYIEVAHNHRYTVAITAADEYHLDFTINVADWTDEGNIDEYEPGGDADENGVKVNVEDVDATYDEDTRTVTMPIVDDSQFTIEGNSTAGYNIRMYYENEDTQHQWLIMETSADTKAAAQSTKYIIKKNNDYKGTHFPVAFIRFTDKVSAKETVVIVQPFAKPSIQKVEQSAGGVFDGEKSIFTFTQTTDVADPYVQFKVFASGGSKMTFGDNFDIPEWLTVSPSAEQSESAANYTLKLNTSNADFPYPYPIDGKTVNFINLANTEMKQAVTLKIKSDLSVSATSSTGSSYNPTDKIITFTPTLATTTSPYITLNVLGTRGSKLTTSDFTAESKWLVIDKGLEQNAYSSNYKITLDALANDFPDDISDKAFSIKNKLDGITNIDVKIKLTQSAPEIKSAIPKNTSSNALSFYDESTKHVHLFNDASSVKLTLFSLGGCTVSSKPNWVNVLTPNKNNIMEFSLTMNGTPSEDAKENIVFTNTSGNTLTVPVYARKKEIRISNFAANNNYTYLNNSITSERPNITYFSSQVNYFTFNVRSPFGVSATDNTSWITTPIVQKTITLSNGDIITTYKITQMATITAATCNTRRKTGTITLKGTTIGTSKYIDLKSEYPTCNIPETKDPPTLVSTSYDKYWMTPLVASVIASQYNSYKNKCPEGWKILSSEEITYFFAGTAVGHTTGSGSFQNTTDRDYAAKTIGYTTVSGGAGWYFYASPSSIIFSLGTSEGNNTTGLRCWRKYSSNDN